MRTHPPTNGSALVFSVMAVTVVSILAAGFLQLTLAVTRRMNSTADTQQAFNLAEAGLAEAYTGLAVARTGNVGSAAAPAAFGGGLLWVEAEEHPNGLVELQCTAMYGTGRATLGLVCEPVALGVGSLGLFSLEDLHLDSGVHLDSYDSSKGSYASQVNTPLNSQGIVGSNGDVSLALGDQVLGKVQYGPTGKLETAKGAVLTGGSSPRSELETLPPVEVPDIELGKLVKHTGGTPMVVPPGEAGYLGLDIGMNAKLILKGPLTIAVGTLTLRLGAQLAFDTADGPVQLYVKDTLDMNSSSSVTTTGEITSDSLIYVSAGAGKTVNFGAHSQFYGFIYAPEAEVDLAAQYELYGGIVCKSLRLAAQGRMHYDLGLGASLEAQLPVLHSWRVVDIPQQVAVKRTDPFQALGLDPNELLSPARAHEDQVLDIRYVDQGGNTTSYFGLESDFDWGVVKELLYGVRDGIAFFLPGDGAEAEAAAADPMLDLVSSAMTSKQLRDAMLAASPVSTEALVAASERNPPMSTSDLKNVLTANYPLSLEALLATVTSTALGSSAEKNVLIDNSPLAPEVLTAVLARVPPLSPSDLLNVLAAQ